MTQYLILTVAFNKESDGRWTAECRELGTATFGDTLEETIEAIEEAVILDLDALKEIGETENFFREHNIQISTVPPTEAHINAPPVGRNLFTQTSVHEFELAGV